MSLLNESLPLSLSWWQFDYSTSVVLAGTGLLGMAAGVTGSFAVLRRRALLGDALAHAALPGVCLAFLIFQERSFPLLLSGAFATGLLGVAIVAFLSKHTRTKEDAAIGIVLSVFFGAGVALLKVIQNISTAGSKAGLDSFIFGKPAAMVTQDVYAIGAVVLALLCSITLFYKEFKLLSFDREFTAVQGWPVLVLDFLLLGLLTVTVVIGLPAVGVVLMAAILILPGAAARFWTENLGRMLMLSGVFGFFMGTAGTLISSTVAAVDLPAGPTIVLAGAAVFMASMLFAPGRGLLAQTLRRLRMSRNVALQNLLRTAYEVIEPALPERRPLSVADLVQRRGWSIRKARTCLERASRLGLAVPKGSGGRWLLTDRGLQQAAHVTRRHRLWELFLIECADIAGDHVDWGADLLEHALPPALEARLEEQLRQSGRLPPEPALLKSPHAIEARR